MVKLLTGNDLLGGQVLWFDGRGWSPDLADAAPLEAEAGAALLFAEVARERICDVALIDAEPSPDGRGYRPAHIRERIRGFGPTVRADLVSPERKWR